MPRTCWGFGGVTCRSPVHSAVTSLLKTVGFRAVGVSFANAFANGDALGARMTLFLTLGVTLLAVVHEAGGFGTGFPRSATTAISHPRRVNEGCSTALRAQTRRLTSHDGVSGTHRAEEYGSEQVAYLSFYYPDEFRAIVPEYLILNPDLALQ